MHVTRKCTERGAVGWWTAVAVSASACSAGPAPSHGPLAVRNQHPAQLTVMRLDPASPSVLPSGDTAVRASTAYSSLFLGDSNATEAFAMDGELMRTSIQGRTGIGAGIELTVELPVVHTSGGFLDGFLIDYHDFFGFPDQGRSVAPQNQFEVFAEQNGQTVWELREETLMLADVPVSATWCLVPPGRSASGAGLPGLALRTGFELPTGDESGGAGNGQFDYAAGLCASWPLAFGTLFADGQYTWAGTPDLARSRSFAFGDVSAASLGLEVPLLSDFSSVAQLSWETSVLRNLDLDRANRDQVWLWLGARMRVDRQLFVEVVFGEDLSPYIAPDFTLVLAMAWLPDQGSAWRGPRP